MALDSGRGVTMCWSREEEDLGTELGGAEEKEEEKGGMPTPLTVTGRLKSYAATCRTNTGTTD
jgi:hypothetical protein